MRESYARAAWSASPSSRTCARFQDRQVEEGSNKDCSANQSEKELRAFHPRDEFAMNAAVRAAFRMLSRSRSVGIGVTGLLARNHSHADAEIDALRGALDDLLLEHDRVINTVFKVQIGIIAAARQGFRKICFQVARRNVELIEEDGASFW